MSLFFLFHSLMLAKKSPPPPPPKCSFPSTGALTKANGQLVCSGFGDRYLNTPKVYDDIAKALLTEGGEIVDGKLVIKPEMVAPVENPDSAECTLLCQPGFEPQWESKTYCTNNVWSHAPSTLSCVPSSCGQPTPPANGKYAFMCNAASRICYTYFADILAMANLRHVSSPATRVM